MSRARAAGVIFLLAALAACFAAPSALATEVSAAQLRALAREAQDSSGALSRLRAVTSVDGRAVDLRAALRGARGEALDRRLETLAASAGDRVAGAPPDPRADAREILTQERFHGGEVPGPFRGLLEWLGRVVPDFEVPLDWLDDLLPGGRSVVWIVLGVLFAAFAGWLARLTLNRRIRVSQAAARAGAAPEDPRTLDRRAAEAEAAGDLEAALRLRFRAGLLRLDARGAIEFRPSISTHEVRRALRSRDFDALATTFDDVVYGGREPRADDVAVARERWPAVVDAARGRERAAA